MHADILPQLDTVMALVIEQNGHHASFEKCFGLLWGTIITYSSKHLGGKNERSNAIVDSKYANKRKTSTSHTTNNA